MSVMCGLPIGLRLGLGMELVLWHIRRFTVYMVSFIYRESFIIDLVDTVMMTSAAHPCLARC